MQNKHNSPSQPLSALLQSMEKKLKLNIKAEWCLNVLWSPFNPNKDQTDISCQDQGNTQAIQPNPGSASAPPNRYKPLSHKSAFLREDGHHPFAGPGIKREDSNCHYPPVPCTPRSVFGEKEEASCVHLVHLGLVAGTIQRLLGYGCAIFQC